MTDRKATETMAALPKKNPKQLARIVEMFSGGYSIAHIARAEKLEVDGEDLLRRAMWT